MRNPVKATKEFVDYLQVDAAAQKIIKEDMTEAECRRVVQHLSRQKIAARAREIIQLAKKQHLRIRPKDALRRARLEWRREFGNFR